MIDQKRDTVTRAATSGWAELLVPFDGSLGPRRCCAAPAERRVATTMAWSVLCLVRLPLDDEAAWGDPTSTARRWRRWRARR